MCDADILVLWKTSMCVHLIVAWTRVLLHWLKTLLQTSPRGTNPLFILSSLGCVLTVPLGLLDNSTQSQTANLLTSWYTFFLFRQAFSSECGPSCSQGSPIHLLPHSELLNTNYAHHIGLVLGLSWLPMLSGIPDGLPLWAIDMKDHIFYMAE